MKPVNRKAIELWFLDLQKIGTEILRLLLSVLGATVVVLYFTIYVWCFGELVAMISLLSHLVLLEIILVAIRYRHKAEEALKEENGRV